MSWGGGGMGSHSGIHASIAKFQATLARERFKTEIRATSHILILNAGGWEFERKNKTTRNSRTKSVGRVARNRWFCRRGRLRANDAAVVGDFVYGRGAVGTRTRGGVNGIIRLEAVVGEV